MGRIKRGGYIFESWVGDHKPKHIHVFKDGKYIAKVEFDDELSVMEGKITAKMRAIIRSLIKEGYFK